MEFLKKQNVELIDKEGSKTSPSALEGQLVAFYFSAHWCPPCQRFTPILKDFYEEVNEEKKRFEVVFVSSDEDDAARQEYMKAMHGSWLCIPFDSPMRNELKRKYGCCAGKEQQAVGVAERRSGIPGLIVVRPDGSELVFEGVAQAENGPVAFEKWMKLQ
mmetsp:Transcript_46585/g.72912  ORF Transcript_46585/g.72912 Transcript_46585/m.72912 type:complete len:160 (-) Transcript_46585:2009-2488(-)